MTPRYASSAVPLAILSAFVLSACAVGPDYQRPDLALPERYGESAVASAPDLQLAPPAGGATIGPQSDAVISSRWWTQFNDPRLDALVDAALTHNANIEQAIARVAEAQATLAQANAAFVPTLSANALTQRARLSQRSFSASPSLQSGAVSPLYDNDQLYAGVSYEIDLWGRLRRASESARAQLLATAFGRDTTRLSVAANVAQTYFALRSIEAQLLATQASLRTREASLELVTKRVRAGYSSSLDQAQAESSRAQAAATLRNDERLRAVYVHALATLTGQLDLQVEPGDARSLPVPASPPPGLPSQLLERRPDVRQSEANLIAANAQIGQALANRFPALTLTGQYGGQSAGLSDLLTAPARFWTLGASAAATVIDGGNKRAQVRAAQARADQATAAYRATVETAFREVADALANVRQTALAEDDLQKQLDAAREQQRIATRRYEAGYADYTTVLDAIRTASDAEIAFVSNRQSRLSYSVDLFKALGGGWDADTAGTP